MLVFDLVNVPYKEIRYLIEIVIWTENWYVLEIWNRKLLWNCHKLLILLTYRSFWRQEFDKQQFYEFSKEKEESNIELRIIRWLRLKLRHCEKATQFEHNLPHVLMFAQCKQWEILYIFFFGLFRKPELWCGNWLVLTLQKRNSFLRHFQMRVLTFPNQKRKKQCFFLHLLRANFIF